ncbi:hypothetical protein L332_06815 [Agrococcus pavilionensis RW1]|uniref:CARDB domain-containing protein n=1 Tax=Agrococcus pavilionensis RW1 TaxID=1330458 RepID=U1LP20_9MICO|nr:DUF6049 family protein [Agrococcus pavilionensis]ERG64164.1 hypothetical protein L332_06815 [Agrococcus pavilionensis RW1]
MLSAGRLARRSASACAVAAVATTLLAAPLTIAPGAVATTGGAESPTLELAPVDPLLSTGEELSLEVALDNRSRSIAPATTVDVLLTASPIATRYSLSRWFAGEAIAANRVVATVELPAVAALDEHSVTVSIDADALGLEGAPWGAYGLAATAPSVTGATSVVVLDEPGEASPTRLALSAPIDAPTGPAGLLDAEQLEASTGDGGDARAALDAALGAGATIGVDPAIGASVAALGDDAPEAAIDWLDRADGPDAYALRYSNADPIAMARAGEYPIEPLGIPREDGPPLPASAGEIGAREPVIDATAVAIGDAELAALAAIGTVVVTTSSLDEEIGGRTPSAHATIDGVDVLAADAELQRLVTAAAAVDPLEAAHARAEAMALLATITRERPSDPRTLAAALPATTQGSTVELLDDLAAAGFVETVGVDDALELEPRDARLAEADAAPSTEGAELVQAALAQEADAARIAGIVGDPSTLLASLRLSLLTALPDAGLPITEEDRQAIEGLGGELADLRTAVEIVGGSEIHAVGESVPMPVTIVNRLDVPAEVVLSLRASNALVNVSQPSTTVTLAPGSQQRVQVPVEIVGTGTVLVIAQLHTPGGVALGQVQTLRVTAQPTIETAVAWVLGSAIALLLVFGIWRSVRKRRSGQARGDLDAPGSSVAAEETG